MSSRYPPQHEDFAFGHSSPPVFQPRQIGVWNFVCSTYDSNSSVAIHWFNGRQVSSHAVRSDLRFELEPPKSATGLGRLSRGATSCETSLVAWMN